MEWSSSQYLKFEDDRTRPARDLLMHVPLDEIESAIDLGCGPGNSTELIAARYPDAQISGADLSEDMLNAARKRLPHIPFFKADLESWIPEDPVDLLFSNAVFQWLPNHLPILTRLIERLQPGGVLAIQMPDNLSEPSHLLMAETANEGPWANSFSQADASRATLPTPAEYLDHLSTVATHVDLWHTVYYHRLENAAAIAEWFKGTGLRPWLDVLGVEEQRAFIARYIEKLETAYPALTSGEVVLRFPRLFIVAQK